MSQVCRRSFLWPASDRGEVESGPLPHKSSVLTSISCAVRGAIGDNTKRSTAVNEHYIYRYLECFRGRSNSWTSRPQGGVGSSSRQPPQSASSKNEHDSYHLISTKSRLFSAAMTDEVCMTSWYRNEPVGGQSISSNYDHMSYTDLVGGAEQKEKAANSILNIDEKIHLRKRTMSTNKTDGLLGFGNVPVCDGLSNIVRARAVRSPWWAMRISGPNPPDRMQCSTLKVC